MWMDEMTVEVDSLVEVDEAEEEEEAVMMDDWPGEGEVERASDRSERNRTGQSGQTLAPPGSRRKNKKTGDRLTSVADESQLSLR